MSGWDEVIFFWKTYSESELDLILLCTKNATQYTPTNSFSQLRAYTEKKSVNELALSIARAPEILDMEFHEFDVLNSVGSMFSIRQSSNFKTAVVQK